MTFKEFMESQEAINQQYVVEVIKYGLSPKFRFPDDDETDIGNEFVPQDKSHQKHWLASTSANAKHGEKYKARSMDEAIKMMNQFIDDPEGIFKVMISRVRPHQVFNKNLPAFIPIVIWSRNPAQPIEWMDKELARLYQDKIKIPKETSLMPSRPNYKPVDFLQGDTAIMH
jgi:hypothetical protein